MGSIEQIRYMEHMAMNIAEQLDKIQGLTGWRVYIYQLYSIQVHKSHMYRLTCEMCTCSHHRAVTQGILHRIMQRAWGNHPLPGPVPSEEKGRWMCLIWVTCQYLRYRPLPTNMFNLQRLWSMTSTISVTPRRAAEQITSDTRTITRHWVAIQNVQVTVREATSNVADPPTPWGLPGV